MDLGNQKTVAVIALNSAEKEQEQKRKLESAEEKPAEIFLCEGQPNRALKILQECRVSGKIAMLYTDGDVGFKYSQCQFAFIQAAAQLASNYNVFVV
ncbi:MAG TPA: hypothetical protein VK254_02115 [Candidatus Bathyarchaeia archaeon]|nr:hypothetical protein [Candidatus Bathyarchaeia archaeon]